MRQNAGPAKTRDWMPDDGRKLRSRVTLAQQEVTGAKRMRPEPAPAPEQRLGRAVRGTRGRNLGGELGLEVAREKPSRSTGKTAGASPDPSTSAEER
ncbi:hypothetical protein NDU88_001939 [Pleurodeles waltl]|uniref:Uncharacterized protein n=1 Tax=Pleurodeles waltl TaxID=8319 RepID=A0AAV7LE88_PLEWA|nr:hypothetical protein NDU88_001939 [Pleurodeles waltl]